MHGDLGLIMQYRNTTGIDDELHGARCRSN